MGILIYRAMNDILAKQIDDSIYFARDSELLKEHIFRMAIEKTKGYCIPYLIKKHGYGKQIEKKKIDYSRKEHKLNMEIKRHSENAKAYLIILALIILSCCFSSCEKEDTECNCDSEFITASGGSYTVPDLPIDCETRQPSASNSNTGGGYFYKCKN